MKKKDKRNRESKEQRRLAQLIRRKMITRSVPSGKMYIRKKKI